MKRSVWWNVVPFLLGAAVAEQAVNGDAFEAALFAALFLWFQWADSADAEQGR